MLLHWTTYRSRLYDVFFRMILHDLILISIDFFFVWAESLLYCGAQWMPFTFSSQRYSMRSMVSLENQQFFFWFLGHFFITSSLIDWNSCLRLIQLLMVLLCLRFFCKMAQNPSQLFLPLIRWLGFCFL